MIDRPKYPVSQEDRHLVCQEEVDGPLQIILEQATRAFYGSGCRLMSSNVITA
jgi:hypothetical protein